MTKVTFLLSKDPILEHGGDVEMSRLSLGLAAQNFDVSAVCCSRRFPVGGNRTSTVRLSA